MSLAAQRTSPLVTRRLYHVNSNSMSCRNLHSGNNIKCAHNDSEMRFVSAIDLNVTLFPSVLEEKSKVSPRSINSCPNSQ